MSFNYHDQFVSVDSFTLRTTLVRFCTFVSWTVGTSASMHRSSMGPMLAIYPVKDQTNFDQLRTFDIWYCIKSSWIVQTMSSSIQIVDSMSSVLDLQILAIEKALLSIDKFLQSGLSSDVSRLISSINFNVRGLITKAIEKVSRRV